MDIIKKLLATGWTKYKIAKSLNVTWGTVNLWARGVWRPKPQMREKLEALLNQKS